MVLESFQRVTEKKKEPSENQQLFLLPLIKLWNLKWHCKIGIAWCKSVELWLFKYIFVL